MRKDIDSIKTSLDTKENEKEWDQIAREMEMAERLWNKFKPKVSRENKKRVQARPQAQNKVFMNEMEKKEEPHFIKIRKGDIQGGIKYTLKANKIWHEPTLTSTGKHKRIKYKIKK
jgi:hypothetical protein